MNFVGIIPARYASTRFPGKPLVDICGKPMIQRVYEQAKKALDTVIVATDDERIYNTVKAFGGEVCMTDAACRCGTERCQQVAAQLHLDDNDVVINIQGDEPFIQPSQIDAIRSCFTADGAHTQIATLVKPFTQEDSLSDLENPNTPKVVFAPNGNALMFSRSVIPYLRGIEREQWLTQGKHYRHIGMYAYRADVLAQIVLLPPTPTEMAESLEQLRWLENGYTIRVAVCDTYSMGIDTPADLEQAIHYLSTNS
ncbi:MAG: 3-deoxy-manno-octulosonate cytidylyltransferase [Paludibacteraceae bacterium]|nr:3-deoxy-manno-octulosonate cytidylyltransferase [Candidatus Colicola coprequi]MCQ2333395.1 3-deoxy-manno-octulosonate cytidylyltransferase [Paludibacteraceae bacterium]